MNPLDFLAVSNGRLRLAPELGPSVELADLYDDRALAAWRALGLLPLAAYLLKHDDRAGAIAPDRRASLEAALMEGRAVAARWAGTLDRVSAALARAQIPVLLFKGADFAFHVYPDPGLRSMVDLDLLVPLARLGEAHAALRDIGFRDDTSCYSAEWYLAGLQRLPPLVDERAGTEVEVHGRAVPSFSPYGPRDEDLWADTLESAWPACRRLSRSWAVWHLAWHATVGHARRSGAFERAKVDVLAMHARSEVEPIDWPQVLARGASTGLSEAIADLLSFVAGRPGCDALRPVAQEARRLAGARRWRARRRFVWHRVRQLAPFLGSRGSWSPALWLQAGRRPARLATSLVRHARRDRSDRAR